MSGKDFWHYAVTLSAVASVPGDDACRELLAVHTAFCGEQDADAVYLGLIAAGRLVVRLQLSHRQHLVLEMAGPGVALQPQIRAEFTRIRCAGTSSTHGSSLALSQCGGVSGRSRS